MRTTAYIPGCRTIADHVALRYGIPSKSILVHSNRHMLSHPRQIAMYLCYLAGYSTPDIGKSLGGMHHTTVLYSVRKVARIRQEMPEMDRFIRECLGSIGELRNPKGRTFQVPPPLAEILQAPAELA